MLLGWEGKLGRGILGGGPEGRCRWAREGKWVHLLHTFWAPQETLGRPRPPPIPVRFFLRRWWYPEPSSGPNSLTAACRSSKMTAR